MNHPGCRPARIWWCAHSILRTVFCARAVSSAIRCFSVVRTVVWPKSCADALKKDKTILQNPSEVSRLALDAMEAKNSLVYGATACEQSNSVQHGVAQRPTWGRRWPCGCSPATVAEWQCSAVRGRGGGLLAGGRRGKAGLLAGVARGTASPAVVACTCARRLVHGASERLAPWTV